MNNCDVARTTTTQQQQQQQRQQQHGYCYTDISMKLFIIIIGISAVLFDSSKVPFNGVMQSNKEHAFIIIISINGYSTT